MFAPRAFVLLFALFLFLPTAARAACPDGLSEITSASREAATIAGIPTSVNCWNPSDPNAGLAAGDDKLFLKKNATTGANIQCLNPKFAAKLKRFMEAVPGGPPKITDGYRGKAAQERARASGASRVGACGSYHQYGLAADFNNNTKQQTAWMRENASRFGIRTIGAWDPNHFQDADGISGQCAVCSSDKGDGTLPDTGPSAYSPSAGVANQLRQALGMQPQAQPFSSPTGSPTGSTGGSSPLPQTPPITSELPQPTQSQFCIPQYKCSGSTLQFQNSFCAVQTVQVCPRGCSLGECIAATSTTPTGTTTTSQTTSTGGSTTAKPAGESVYDILERMTGVTTTPTEIATSTPLQLLLSLSLDQVDTAATTTLTVPATSSTHTVQGQGVQTQFIGAQQTFVSSDLAGMPVQQPVQQPVQNQSILFSILETAKNILLWMLNYLQPFSPARYGGYGGE